MRKGGNNWQSMALMLLATAAAIAFILKRCAPEEQAPFILTQVTCLGSELAVNGPIELKFSDNIHLETPVQALISLVNTGDFEAVPFHTTVEENRVILRPFAATNWPENSVLRLQVRRGLAVPFRNQSRRTLEHDYHYIINVGNKFLDYGQLLEFFPPPLAARSNLQVGSSFTLRASLPLDPDSIRQSQTPATLQIIQDNGKFGPTSQVKLELADRNTKLVVTPWPTTATFLPSCRYRLFLHKDVIKARNGSQCEQEFTVSLSSGKFIGFEGHIDVSFLTKNLPLEENPSLDPSLEGARPQLAPITTKSAGAKSYAHLTEAPTPWNREGSRSQLRIPGSLLGEMPGTITGFSWFCGLSPESKKKGEQEKKQPYLIAQDIIFPRLLIRLGHATREVQESGLNPNFESNISSNSATPAIQTVMSGSIRGEYVVRQRLAEWHKDAPLLEDGAWIDFMFERPFHYAGNRRDVVIEINNINGSSTLDGKKVAKELLTLSWWVKESEVRNPNFLLQSRDWPSESGKNLLASMEFATRIHIQNYLEVISAWYVAEIDNPEYFLIPSADYLDAKGAEHEDFRFLFQGRRPDGSLTPWSRLEAIENCRKIRVRLRFLPQTGKGIGSLPQVKRLRIRYRRR